MKKKVASAALTKAHQQLDHFTSEQLAKKCQNFTQQDKIRSCFLNRIAYLAAILLSLINKFIYLLVFKRYWVNKDRLKVKYGQFISKTKQMLVTSLKAECGGNDSKFEKFLQKVDLVLKAFEENYDHQNEELNRPHSFAHLTMVADIIGEDIVPTGKLMFQLLRRQQRADKKSAKNKPKPEAGIETSGTEMNKTPSGGQKGDTSDSLGHLDLDLGSGDILDANFMEGDPDLMK